MTAEQNLRAAFSETLGLEPGVDFEGLAYRVTATWDSVAHMQLVNALESRFGIMLETDDVIDLSSFPKARTILGKYGVTF
jgi:acyl carrier protein